MRATNGHLDEARRLESLHSLRILDTAPEEAFDTLAQLAAALCNVPIALVTLIDAQRQWFKANVGLSGICETAREVAFCDQAILGTGVLEVPDATIDPRFADNPLLTAAPHIRFYAGAPLILSDGSRVGTLCVIDRRARKLSARQHRLLQQLAATAVLALEGRRALLAERSLLATQTRLAARLRRLYEMTPGMRYSTDANGYLLEVSNQWLSTLGYARAEVIGRPITDFLIPDVHGAGDRTAQATVGMPGLERFPYRLHSKSGRIVNMLVTAMVDCEDHDCILHSVEVRDDAALHRIALRTGKSLLDTIRAQFIMSIADVSGTIIDVNESFCAISGYPRSALIGSDHRLLGSGVHPPDFFTDLWRTVLAGNLWRGDICNRAGDGHLYWVDSVVVPLKRRDGSVERVMFLHSDITDRKSQQAAMSAFQERMELATDSGEIGIWDWNLVTDVLTWDAWMYRLHDMTPGSGAPSHAAWRDCLHPDDQAAAQAAVTTAIAGAGLDCEFRIIDGTGAVRHLRTAGRATCDSSGCAIRLIGACWDVSRKCQLSDDLASQHALLRVTLQAIGDAVITTDAKANVTWLNPAAERLTGWGHGDACGRPVAEVFGIIDESSREPRANPVAACLADGVSTAVGGHAVLVARNGDEFGIVDNVVPIRDAHGVLLGAVLVFHDVTEQRRIAGEMHYRATHDALTGLVNRVEFEARLRTVLNYVQVSHGEHALLYIDLDQFKNVNDACGHFAGDDLLKDVGKRLLEVARLRDTVARLGGDEFAVILEHCPADQALRVAQEICERMDDLRFVREGKRFRIGASIGLVVVDSRWNDTSVVLQAADSACYAAKEAGRNCVYAWSGTDTNIAARHGEMRWTTLIEQALDDNGFVLFAQRIEPLCASQHGLHAEVLLRLRLDDGRMVLPGAFLPAAERFQLASRIDRWVLHHALAWLVRQPDLGAIRTLSINLSGQSIGDAEFRRHALQVLEALGTAACGCICFEITETAAITNIVAATDFVAQARLLGVRMALDDFGTGAASFGYLKALPVAILKIDGQFSRHLPDDVLDDAAVRCFADVARLRGLHTVAECVDRPESMQRLRDIGIDFAQGFMLHQPAPLDQLSGAPAACPTNA